MPRTRVMIGFSFWSRTERAGRVVASTWFHDHADRIVIAFDDCDDAVQERARVVARDILAPGVYEELTSDGPGEIRCHNALIAHFLKSDCDVLIVLQDDMELNASIITPALRMIKVIGPTFGIAGGRDGKRAGQMYSSIWSKSNADCWLALGEYTEATEINTGPIIYSRATAYKVGFLDEEFVAFYAWSDYARRCANQGLKTFVMGTPIQHQHPAHRTEKMRNTIHYANKSSGRDANYFKSKWGNAGVI